MQNDIDMIAEIRSRMFKLSICQIDIVNKLIEKKGYSPDLRSSLSTQVNFALTGKRKTKRYVALLKEISEVLSEIESEN